MYHDIGEIETKRDVIRFRYVIAFACPHKHFERSTMRYAREPRCRHVLVCGLLATRARAPCFHAHAPICQLFL